MIRNFTLIFSFIALFLFCGHSAWSASGSAISNGNWNDPYSWLINSVNRVPTCGDTITVPAAKTITVASQENLIPCGYPVVIIVQGTLQFTNGNKLDLPCGSWVYIASGGLVKKATAGGGSSTLITICGYVEWKAGDGPLTGPDSLGGHGTLPVTWLNVQATVAAGNVKVDWSTGSEINNNFFTVQRSSDGTHYTSIGTMAGKGNTTQPSQYTFTDENPIEGLAYYKLLQVDYDGAESSSDVVAVNNSIAAAGIDQVIISPNPVASSANIRFRCFKDSAVQIEVKNSSGQVCVQETIDAKKGANTYVFMKANKLYKGIYTLVISNSNTASRTVGFIKR